LLWWDATGELCEKRKGFKMEALALIVLMHRKSRARDLE
jgi:hypothetical protein